MDYIKRQTKEGSLLSWAFYINFTFSAYTAAILLSGRKGPYVLSIGQTAPLVKGESRKLLISRGVLHCANEGNVVG